MTTQAIFARRAFTPREEIADAVIVVDGQKIVAVGPRDRSRHTRGRHPAGSARPHRRAGLRGRAHPRRRRPRRDGGHARSARRRHRGRSRGTARRRSWPPPSPPAKDAPARPLPASPHGCRRARPESSARPRARRPKSWASTSKARSSVPRGAACIRRNGSCRPRSICSQVSAMPRRAPRASSRSRRSFPARSIWSPRPARRAASFRSATPTPVTRKRWPPSTRGARHAAHVFNAMRPFAHRDSGVIGAVLASPQ